jgi:hypothetical protein
MAMTKSGKLFAWGKIDEKNSKGVPILLCDNFYSH